MILPAYAQTVDIPLGKLECYFKMTRILNSIARGQPILVNGEDIILDKQLILELLGTLEETAKRVERLFIR